MNELPINYAFEDALVRVVMREGEPWFVAKDVCTVLGVKDASDAVEPLDDDEKGRGLIPTLGGEQEVLVVSESGLYTLILRSRQATTPGTAAHRFRKWVTAELLPQLRKTGRYTADDPNADVPLYELNTRLRQIEIGIKLGGKAAGRKLWQDLGMPEIPGLEPVPIQPRGALQGLDFVRRFLAERTAEAPGGRVQARELYSAYVRWAGEAGAPTMTETAFALCTRHTGIEKARGNIMHYIGIRILHFTEFAADIER